jgi:shikimate kinase
MRIVLTGPRSVGKSTVSKLVAEKLGLKYISSDEIGEKLSKKHGGLDAAIKSGIIRQIIKTKGYTVLIKLFKQDNFVLDLSGGSISSRRTPKASRELRTAAKKSSIIIGLLPYKTKNKSIEFLSKREKKRKHFSHLTKKEIYTSTKDSYEKFPPIFKSFCDKIIYTENKSPEIIAEEIVNIIISKYLSIYDFSFPRDTYGFRLK